MMHRTLNRWTEIQHKQQNEIQKTPIKLTVFAFGRFQIDPKHKFNKSAVQEELDIIAIF